MKGTGKGFKTCEKGKPSGPLNFEGQWLSPSSQWAWLHAGHATVYFIWKDSYSIGIHTNSWQVTNSLTGWLVPGRKIAEKWGQRGLGKRQMDVLSRSVMFRFFATPWTIVLQAPLSILFPSKNTGVGCYFLLHWIFLTQGSNLYFLHWQTDSLLLSHQKVKRYIKALLGSMISSALHLALFRGHSIRWLWSPYIFVGYVFRKHNRLLAPIFRRKFTEHTFFFFFFH